MVKWDSPVAWQESEKVAILLNPSPMDALGEGASLRTQPWLRALLGRGFPPHSSVPQL